MEDFSGHNGHHYSTTLGWINVGAINANSCLQKSCIIDLSAKIKALESSLQLEKSLRMEIKEYNIILQRENKALKSTVSKIQSSVSNANSDAGK